MLQKPQSELFHKQPCMEQTHSAEKITAKQKQNKKRKKKKPNNDKERYRSHRGT